MSANDGDHVISSGDSASARFLNEPSVMFWQCQQGLPASNWPLKLY